MNREQRGEALWGGISGALLEEHPRGPKASRDAHSILPRDCPQRKTLETHFVHFKMFVLHAKTGSLKPSRRESKKGCKTRWVLVVYNLEKDLNWGGNLC